MKSLIAFIINGRRNEALGLLAIGGIVLICSHIAEREIADRAKLECANAFVIVAGIAVTAILFRRRRVERKCK